MNNMIHLYTSKTFSDDLNKAGCPLPAAKCKNTDWHRYAHRITLLRKKCVIVMEEASRYALTFGSLKTLGFAHFDKLLTNRIIAERGARSTGFVRGDL